jgi:hypothetical protein
MNSRRDEEANRSEFSLFPPPPKHPNCYDREIISLTYFATQTVLGPRRTFSLVSPPFLLRFMCLRKIKVPVMALDMGVLGQEMAL